MHVCMCVLCVCTVPEQRGISVHSCMPEVLNATEEPMHALRDLLHFRASVAM